MHNPYVQARNRVEQLRRVGHSMDKVEFILMGGTSCRFLWTTEITSFAISMMHFLVTHPEMWPKQWRTQSRVGQSALA